VSSPTVRTPARAAGSSTPLPSPPATRAARPGWRDPRLVVGILLVCVSVVVGARLLAGADDTVPVLVAAGPLAAGERLDEGDLVTARVRFADAQEAARYLSDDAALTGTVLLRPVGAGELVPRAAIGPAGAPAQVSVPLPVDASRVPGTVRSGSVVDVWAGPDPQADSRVTAHGDDAERLLREVPVLSVERPDGLGPGTVVQVVVGVPEAKANRIAEAVAGLSGQSLLVVAHDN